ncbi:hypothetical protein J2046_001615 [Rhizobium petrolearium]|uniref:hypothetical protein n=1 Tax=Neorhizobium petrolearium TaxID=515361 RepID=UPI001AE2A367|nr:hypothetical protein [Neorhizobium petrolearium]MBP1843361.1 hypothetical protein [Neorhizobium petrolearium]
MAAQPSLIENSFVMRELTETIPVDTISLTAEKAVTSGVPASISQRNAYVPGTCNRFD